MRFEPDISGMPLALQLAVPVALPLPPRLLVHATPVTAVLESIVVPHTFSVPAAVVKLALLVGEVIESSGEFVGTTPFRCAITHGTVFGFLYISTQLPWPPVA